MVKKPIRENSILNVFMTNTPYLEKKTKVIKSTVRSDHNMVIVIPRTPVKAKRTTTILETSESKTRSTWLIYSRITIGR